MLCDWSAASRRLRLLRTLHATADCRGVRCVLFVSCSKHSCDHSLSLCDHSNHQFIDHKHSNWFSRVWIGWIGCHICGSSCGGSILFSKCPQEASLLRRSELYALFIFCFKFSNFLLKLRIIITNFQLRVNKQTLKTTVKLLPTIPQQTLLLDLMLTTTVFQLSTRISATKQYIETMRTLQPTESEWTI